MFKLKKTVITPWISLSLSLSQFLYDLLTRWEDIIGVKKQFSILYLTKIFSCLIRSTHGHPVNPLWICPCITNKSFSKTSMPIRNIAETHSNDGTFSTFGTFHELHLLTSEPNQFVSVQRSYSDKSLDAILQSMHTIDIMWKKTSHE